METDASGGESHTTTDLPELSVVVVTYNESDNVDACLQSVFDCCGARDLEVVVVDSNSSDDTVQRAGQFPVDVYRITDDDLCTPGAGRYVGTAVTSGERILFVDGDMQLRHGWLDAAIERLDADPELAGVDGHLNSSMADDPESVDSLRGVAVYDRECLDAVGGFDPHLRALEDVELGYRLQSAGFRLRRLPGVFATHPVETGMDEKRRRWENGYYHGRGEVIRKSLSSPLVLWKFLYHSRLYLAVLAWGVLGGVAALLGVAGLALWLGGSILLGTAFALQQGPRRAGRKVVGFVPVYAGLLGGFLDAPPDPETFPMEAVERVTDQENGEQVTNGSQHLSAPVGSSAAER